MKDKSGAVLCAVMIIALYSAFHIAGIGCPIKFLSGVSCAGCGMTRAISSALRGSFADAFAYHPLFMLPPVYIILLMLKNKLPPNLFSGITRAFAAAMAAVYIFRLFDTSDSIVVFEPLQGVIFKLFFIKKGVLLW